MPIPMTLRRPRRPGRVLRTAALLLTVLLAAAGPLSAQEIPKDQYLRYVPLDYPRMNLATEANRELLLFGDPDAAGYVDENPVDGIDDRRHAVLQELGVRFAPIMVQNAAGIPMDFKAFMRGRTSFPLYADVFNLAGAGNELVRTDEVNWLGLGRGGCPPELAPDGVGAATLSEDDCRLLQLLNEFYPFEPGNALSRTGIRGEGGEEFKVLYFDFPGHDEQSWREEFENLVSRELPRQYRDIVKTYVHPFAVRVEDPVRGFLGYELVLQYWFFYSFNDGGNNHEGDWEHLNVVVAPKDRLGQPLSADEVSAILNGDFERDADAPDGLVARRLEYYIHQRVMVLDMASPNVYQPLEEWKREVDRLPEERANERKVWSAIRAMAYRDREGAVNTHPIIYIGADNKGTDQLLSMPGGKNRDSHASYPFPGLYKDIGSAGATEQINHHFDHWKYFAAREAGDTGKFETWKRGGVVPFDLPERVEVIPDWELVVDLVRERPEARYQSAWMVLPIRWGWPAVESPFAGIVAHAETGNLAPVGPTYSTGWNRLGESGSFSLYEPHRFPSTFPLGWQDNFKNSWGFLNLTLPSLISLPPFDVGARVIAAPVRALLGDEEPIYFPKENVPFRFVGVVGGVSVMDVSEEFGDLTANGPQFEEFVSTLVDFIVVNTPPGDTANFITDESFEDNMDLWDFGIQLHLGDRFTTENRLRHGRSRFGSRFLFDILPPFEAEYELNFWEYTGTIQYNLRTGILRPSLRGGYGWSWYRLEKGTINGQSMENPDSPWVRKPFTSGWTIWPDTWSLGAGLEFIPFRSVKPPPGGIDLSIQLTYAMHFHKLGLDEEQVPVGLLTQLGFGAADLPRDQNITRHMASLLLMISF